MTKSQRIFLLVLSASITIATLTLAYGAYKYTGNRPVHEEYENFE